MLLVGGSITCAGVLIALWLLGVWLYFTSTLLIVLVLLVVIGATVLIVDDYRSTRTEQ
jgi:heme/copper-type cytochrome/quinol oxidase subunit 2